jgi:hypothetical protein
MQIRHVLTRISFARYNVRTCQEVDYAIWFDVTAFANEQIFKFVRAWMTRNYPSVSYEVVRSKRRPGYAYVKFTQDHGLVEVKS